MPDLDLHMRAWVERRWGDLRRRYEHPTVYGGCEFFMQANSYYLRATLVQGEARAPLPAGACKAMHDFVCDAEAEIAARCERLYRRTAPTIDIERDFAHETWGVSATVRGFAAGQAHADRPAIIIEPDTTFAESLAASGFGVARA